MNRKTSDDESDPFFQQGKSAGLKAEDLLSLELEELAHHREHFLRGYITGLKLFIEEAGIQLPTGMDLDVLAEPTSLLSYSQGLRRKNPHLPYTLGGGEESGLCEESEKARAWSNALTIMTGVVRSDGYFLGFVVGASRDFGIKLDQWHVPDSSPLYDVFAAGLGGKPYDSVPKPHVSVKWADDISRRLSAFKHRGVYDTGVEIRSRSTG